MDSNDARRSKVPAGTFRSSNRPPPPGPEDKVAPGAATPPPPPPAATSARPAAPPIPAAAATPTRRVGTPSAAPPKLVPPTEVDGRNKFTSTLVGVTPSKAPPPPAAGPVLAPPPWRGASAYQGGQDPQPRVSAISSPGVLPSVLADGTVAHPDDRRVPNTRITAAAPPAPSPEVEKPSAATAEIGDAIQQLLDSQTAVSMEGVQEAVPSGTLRGQHGVSSGTLRGQPTEEFLRDSALEPVRESQIEMVRDSAIVEEVAEPVRSLPPAAPVAKRSQFDQTERTRVEPSAVPEPRPAPSARWSATPTPVVRPAAPEPSLSDRELAAYSFVEREERDASVAPAEVRGQAAAAAGDDSNVRLGLMVAAAILIVGVGGWAATRGGFHIPKRTPIAAPAIAAPPPAAPAVVAPVVPSPELGDVEPTPAPATTTKPAQPATATVAPSAPPAVAPVAPTKPEPPRTPVAARPARVPRPEPEEQAPAAEPAPTPAPAADEAVLKVSPSTGEAAPTAATTPEPAAPTGPLPETPTRENVQSALDATRTEVLTCAAGQHGVAEVDLTVMNNGVVTHAVVAGDFAGTAAGSCIARVVRTARFAPFSKPRFRVIYPFSL